MNAVVCKAEKERVWGLTRIQKQIERQEAKQTDKVILKIATCRDPRGNVALWYGAWSQSQEK
jgi:hypothetical protein